MEWKENTIRIGILLISLGAAYGSNCLRHKYIPDTGNPLADIAVVTAQSVVIYILCCIALAILVHRTSRKNASSPNLFAPASNPTSPDSDKEWFDVTTIYIDHT